MKEWLKPEFRSWVVARVFDILSDHKEKSLRLNRSTELDEDRVLLKVSPCASVWVWQEDLFYRLTKLSQWQAMDKALAELVTDHRIECTKFVEQTDRKGRPFKRYFAVLDILDAMVRATSDPTGELLLPTPAPKQKPFVDMVNPLGDYAKRRRELRLMEYKDNANPFHFWNRA